MFKLNGKPVSILQDLVVGEGDEAITYPVASLQDPATRAGIGIVEVPDEPRPDDRFYWVVDNGDGTFTATPKDKAVVIDMLWEQIKAHRDALQVAGCPVGADWFHNDVKSRTQWERMANKANKLGLADADQYQVDGKPVPWKTMAGTFVPLTAGKIRQAVDTFEVREVAVFAAAEQHKAALTAKATVEEMIAYDWRAGWPVAFEGAL